MQKKKKRIFAVLLSAILVVALTGCSKLGSIINEIHGSLIGNNYTVYTYDNYGNQTLKTSGKKISITGNKIETVSYDSDGRAVTGYDLSSVITITIDGKEIESCGDTCVFVQKGLEPEVDFSLDEVNNGVNHLHGGTKNFANRIWESRVETNRVVMSLVSEDGDQGYPGELCVEAVFDFDDDNALEITYLARTDKTTVVNLTNHVYFNLAGEGSGSVLDHELRLNSSKILEMNERQIPTGKLLDAAGTPQDFREFRSFRPGISSEFNHIRDFKGYDHPFVVDGWKPNILGEVGTLREPRSGRSVTVLSSQPSVMIYTGNWLASGCPETKSGGRYADYDGVAMECQNYPDAVNHPEFPSPLLRPGETYCQKIVFRFGTFA